MTIVRGSRTKRRSRSNVESDLKLQRSPQKYVSFPAKPHNTFDGSFEYTHSFFVGGSDDLTSFQAFYGEHTNSTDGFVIFTEATAGNTFSLVARWRDGIADVSSSFLNLPENLLVNRTHFVLVCRTNLVTAGNNEADLYINGSFHSTVVATGASGIMAQSFTDFFIGSTSAISTSCSMSHYCVFNKGLTPAEIIDIYESGGVLPASTHVNCVAHYPLTERYGFKADAAFIAKHPQFALNDHVIFDSVEQYNYAKASGAITAFADGGGGQVIVTSNAHGRSNGMVVNITDTTNYNGTYAISAVTANTYEITATWVATETGNWNQFISANHAELVNYTDVELGLSTTDPATVIKEFYSKKELAFAFAKFNGTDSKVSTPHAANLTMGDGLGANVSFSITATFIPYANQARIFEKGQELSTTGRQYILTVGSTGTIQFLIFSSSVLVIGTYNVTFGKKYFVSATYDNTASDIRLGMRLMVWEDGVLVSDDLGTSSPANVNIVASSETQLIGAGDNLHADADISDVRIHSVPLSYTQSERVKQGEYSGSEISRWVLNDFPTLGSGNTAKDVVGSNDGTTTNLIRANEVSSLIPEILNSLKHETGISISATYTSIVGMGFTIQLLTDISLLSEIITGLPAITKYKINGVEVASEALLIAAINHNELCHIDLEWSSASPTITFVHTGEDYELIRDYYLDETLTPRESKQLTNNILFYNPKQSDQTKFNYYALHNEGNYIAGATDPENVPLIDVDTIGNRASLGWTGGDAATKLADLVTNLSNINDLR